MDLGKKVNEAAGQLGYRVLKEKQREAIVAFSVDVMCLICCITNRLREERDFWLPSRSLIP